MTNQVEETIAKAVRIEAGSVLSVSGSVGSQVFDALRKAGLLVEIPATEQCTWKTWGYDTDEERIVFTLISEPVED